MYKLFTLSPDLPTRYNRLFSIINGFAYLRKFDLSPTFTNSCLWNTLSFKKFKLRQIQYASFNF